MSFTLFYSSGVVFLRSPELGDSHSVNTYVENRETIGGEVKSVKDSSWPDKEIRSFSFTNLTKTVTDTLRTALINSAGEEVSIIDHNDKIWTGVIISNPIDIITQRDVNCGSYDVSFEMMCEYNGVPVLLQNNDNNTVYNNDEVAIKVI